MMSECCVIYTAQTAENITPRILISIPSGLKEVETEMCSGNATLVEEVPFLTDMKPSLDGRQNYSREAGKIRRERILEEVNKKHYDREFILLIVKVYETERHKF